MTEAAQLALIGVVGVFLGVVGPAIANWLRSRSTDRQIGKLAADLGANTAITNEVKTIVNGEKASLAKKYAALEAEHETLKQTLKCEQCPSTKPEGI